MEEQKSELEKPQIEKPAFNHKMVEKALYKRAKGFSYYEITKEPDEENPEKEKIVKKQKKTVIPDVSACIFWLKNRLPDKWRDPKDIESDKVTLKDFLEHYDENK